MIPVLETPRLILRAPETADHALYAAFLGRADGPSAFYGGPLRPDEAFQRLAADRGHWALRGHGKWILERRSDGQAVGGCGLVHPPGWPRHELTWWLAEEARGAGLATEASVAAIRWGYDVLGLDPVETHMRDENAAAHALARRLGGWVIARERFPDGATRDVYALPHPDRTQREAMA
ncbi:MAG: GNAT family N-acetyltransferase [Pseudomonadota bacterium]